MSTERLPRSSNLKLSLTYDEWKLTADCIRTVTAGLKRKGYAKAAMQTGKLLIQVEDILAAQRSEGHV